MKRALVLVGALALMAGLAFLVAHPTGEPPAATPYLGERGASRTTASGLAIWYARDGESHPLAPGTHLRADDQLRFSVRAERPRYLMVRLRDGADAAVTIFPIGEDQAPLVQPRQALPGAHVVAAGAGKVVVSAVFSDHPFAVDGPPADDAEIIDVVMEKD
jgi:hypothetical protein